MRAARRTRAARRRPAPSPLDQGALRVDGRLPGSRESPARARRRPRRRERRSAARSAAASCCAKRSSTARAARLRRPGRACSRASWTRSARSTSSSWQAASLSAASCSSSAVFRWIVTRISRMIMSPTGSPRAARLSASSSCAIRAAAGRVPEPLQAARRRSAGRAARCRRGRSSGRGGKATTRPTPGLEKPGRGRISDPAAVGGDPVTDRQREHEALAAEASTASPSSRGAS